MSQRNNPALASLAMSTLSRSADAAFQWGNAASAHLLIPNLRGFWPMSSRNTANSAIDLSGQALTAAQVGGALTYSSYALSPYVEYDGTNHLNVGTGGSTDLAGALALGGWFYFAGAAGGAGEMLIGRTTNAAGGRQYWLRRDNTTGTISFLVSSDGTALTTVTSTVVPDSETWYWIAGRYDPSNEIKLWVDDNEYTNTTAIPAALFTSGAVNFTLGGSSGGTIRLDGRASLNWIAAAAIDDVLPFALYEHTRAMFKKSVV